MTDPSDPAGASSQSITIPQVLETLSRGVIQDDHGMLPWGSNYAYLVSVSDEERTVLAVYKPQRGERPLWDFPDGTLCYREVAAFLVSEFIGWQIVPPTVLRGGPYGLGSVQFYIDHDPQINYFTPLPEACIPQLQRVAVFDYLINNADRKGGHCLLDSQSHLWGIDHGISFHYQPKLRTVIWDFAGQPLPESILQSIMGLCDSMAVRDTPMNQALREFLSEREVAAFHKRLEYLMETRQFVSPGAGPNYPWPPV